MVCLVIGIVRRQKGGERRNILRLAQSRGEDVRAAVLQSTYFAHQ
jgi:hypothetical protein